MKAKVLQENLHKALTNASRFVNSRAQLPVLGNILLKASKTSLLISSTNLETAVSILVGAQVEKEGEITVPAKAISEAVANLLPGSISLQAEKEQLKIDSQGSSLKIAGMNRADIGARSGATQQAIGQVAGGAAGGVKDYGNYDIEMAKAKAADDYAGDNRRRNRSVG